MRSSHCSPFPPSSFFASVDSSGPTRLPKAPLTQGRRWQGSLNHPHPLAKGKLTGQQSNLPIHHLFSTTKQHHQHRFQFSPPLDGVRHTLIQHKPTSPPRTTSIHLPLLSTTHLKLPFASRLNSDFFSALAPQAAILAAHRFLSI